MILLPEDIIRLILSYAPDFRDNLKRCQKEMMLIHRPLYVKKVVGGFSPGIADSPTWHNFKKNDEIRVLIRDERVNRDILLKLHAIEITPYRARSDRNWHYRDRYINLYYGWINNTNNKCLSRLFEWNTKSISYEFTPGYY